MSAPRTTAPIASDHIDDAMRIADCPTCQGDPSNPWVRARRAAAYLCGPHPVVTDLRCPLCRAGVGERCRRSGAAARAHAGRTDRYLTAHLRYQLLIANLADAATDLTGGQPERSTVAITAAEGRHRELERLMRDSGLTYRVPSAAEVLAAVR